MLKIAAKGKSVRMGATGELASANEGPRLNAGFTYDFWFDVVEVTQSRFGQLQGDGVVFVRIFIQFRNERPGFDERGARLGQTAERGQCLCAFDTK